MRVKVEYTLHKTMEVEIPKALSEAYKAAENSGSLFEWDAAYVDIAKFADAYVKAEEGKDNVDTIFEWDEMEG